MNPNTPETNPQAAGAPQGQGDPAEEARVATGDRRDLHYEADPDQLVVARSLVRPERLPPEMLPAGADESWEPDWPPVEDVRVAPDGPSVWDARPSEE